MDQEVQEILKFLIDEDLMDFKCFDILKEKLQTDLQFRETVKKGISEGLIDKFPRELFDKICEQNIRAPFEPIQIFIDGANLGNCTIMSKMISYSLPAPDLCGGTLKVLEGTKNSPDGSHTWVSYRTSVKEQPIIIDPSLMIMIRENFSKEFGYVEENRYDPRIDRYYNAAKDFANDKSIKRHI